MDKGSYPHSNGWSWNAFRRLTTQASPDERDALCQGTVSNVHRLG